MNNTYKTSKNQEDNTLIPFGYKKTAIGIIPIDWETKKLGDLGDIINGLTYSPNEISDDGILVLRSSNIKDRQLIYTDNVFVKADKFNPVKKEDILICVRNGSKSLIGKNALITEEAEGYAFGAFMAVFRSDYNNYLYQIFGTDLFQKEIHKNLGATINSINGSDLKLFKLPIPPQPEQQKIAEILSTWDDAITNCKATIISIKDRNKGLAQQLLLGKIRLSGFSDKWEVKPLCDMLIYTPREVDKPYKPFLALGLRSHGKGVFHKPDFEPNAIAMTKLFEVKENDLVVNITFAWEQAIAIASKEDEGGLVSHRFPTYTFNPKTASHLYFKFFILQSFFKSMLELISPGGAGRNRVMSKKDFLKLEVKVPKIEEQIAIAQVLETADQELKSYEAKLEALQLQKRGLMQQLLTGKIRVNVN